MVDFSEIKDLFNIKNGDGCSESEIQTAINKWGTLPHALVQYYIELGAEDIINHTEDNLLGPSELEEVDGYLRFYEEAQGSVDWCVRMDSLSFSDPPVFCRMWLDGKYAFVLTSSDMTSFFKSMACMQAMFGLKYNSEGMFIATEQQIMKIKDNFSIKDFSLSTEPQVHFFGKYHDDVIVLVCDSDQPQVGYASQSKDHFDEIHCVLTENV